MTEAQLRLMSFPQLCGYAVSLQIQASYLAGQLNRITREGTTMAMNPLIYLKQQLSFTSQEWMTLSDADKNTLKEWATQEQASS